MSSLSTAAPVGRRRYRVAAALSRDGGVSATRRPEQGSANPYVQRLSSTSATTGADGTTVRTELN